MKMKIGNLKIKNNILLAPMSGVTDFPYREIVKKFKPGLVFSEMIASRALIEKDFGSIMDKLTVLLIVKKVDDTIAGMINKIVNGFVIPPVKYNKTVSCKRS